MTDRERTPGAPPVDALIDEAVAAVPAAGPPHGWWRRNLVGIVAFVVLAVLTAGIVGLNGWFSYYDGRPSVAIEIPPGTGVDYGGAHWQLESLTRLDADDPLIDSDSLPAGTDVVVAVLRVEPSDQVDHAPSCSLSVVERRPGGEDRSWSLEPGGAWADYEEDRETGCDSELTGPYTVEGSFVVPSSADGTLLVRVEVPDAFPRYLELSAR